MEIINGKVWIENTSKKITNVSQLNFNIYKTIRELINAGAIIEIGPGNPPEYGNGIYCTNLNIDEIVSILNKKDLNKKKHKQRM